jgi:hypothetical protein
MSAGLVPLVSESTGTRQLVRDVSDRLIAPLDAGQIAERISWYFGLPTDARKRLSEWSRTAAQPYTEEAATARYQATFAAMCRDLGLAR